MRCRSVVICKDCTCVCSDGNECARRPCVNGGTCVDDNHMYRCVCPPRTPALTGVNCSDSTSHVKSFVIVALVPDAACCYRSSVVCSSGYELPWDALERRSCTSDYWQIAFPYLQVRKNAQEWLYTPNIHSHERLMVLVRMAGSPR